MKFFRKKNLSKIENQLTAIENSIVVLNRKITEIEKRSIFTSDSIKDPLSNLNKNLVSIKSSISQPFWKQQELALRIIDAFTPKVEANLIRVGSNFDGGYFVPEEIVNSAKCVVNIGIGNETSLDVDLSKRGFTLFCFDPFIDFYPQPELNVKFVKKGLNISNPELNTTLVSIVKNYINKNVTESLLFMDIEGSEIDTIINLDEVKSIKEFPVLVIEFHNLLQYVSKTNTQDFEKLVLGLSYLKKYFDICNVSGNNSAEYLKFESKIFPDVLEVTFVNKNLGLKENMHKNNYASANDPNRPILDLNNW